MSKKQSKVVPKMEQFGGHFETRFKAIRNLGSQAPPWTALAPFWGYFGVMLGVILCDFGCRFANSFCFLSCLNWAPK